MLSPARAICLKIHRWLGLALAAFLVMAGITGVALAFHDELDGWLNPHLFRVEPQGERLSPVELRARAERLVSPARIDQIPLRGGPTDAVEFHLSGRADPASPNQLFLNPYTGAELGRRLSTQLSLDREHFMECVFRLHRHLLMGKTGSWILVFIAIAWFVSSLIGLYLTFPPKGRRFFAGWKPAWRVQWSAPLPRLSFDLHRATALWLFAILIVVSFSAMRVTLGDVDLFDGIIKSVAPVYDADRAIEPHARPIEGEPKLAWGDALLLGRRLMAERARVDGFDILGEASLSLNRERGVYAYGVRSTNDVFDGGETELYFSAFDGREIALAHPYSAVGNAISSWLGALHRARVGGVPYKLLVQLAGLATTTLAITGFIVWLKRRRPAKAR